MVTFFSVVHVLVCVALVASILQQVGKGADMGAMFGGSSSNVFGATGATSFITKLTSVLAVLFIITSIILARSHKMTSRQSVVDFPQKTEQPAPALKGADQDKAQKESTTTEQPKEGEVKPDSAK